MSAQHPLFPVNLIAQWDSPDKFHLNAHLANWLLDADSLTARLKSHCSDFNVVVLGQQIEACNPAEANEDVSAGEQVLVREVLLYCDDVPQVFARSLLPLASLTGEEQQLAHLGNQSLGQVLFNNDKLIRKKIEIAAFDQSTSVAHLAEQLSLTAIPTLHGRRSVFMLNGKPLMVAEVFLPGAFAYQEEKQLSE